MKAIEIENGEKSDMMPYPLGGFEMTELCMKSAFRVMSGFCAITVCLDFCMFSLSFLSVGNIIENENAKWQCDALPTTSI